VTVRSQGGLGARGIDAVLLDVGGVFLLPDPAVLLPIVRSAGAASADEEDLRRGHYAGVAAMDRHHPTGPAPASGPNWAAYAAALVAEVGATPGAAPEIERAFGHLGWRRVVPGSVEALRRLADTGVALAIVSNADGTIEEQLLDARICQIGEGEHVPVAVVLDSGIVGIEKPEPAIFHQALTALGVDPGRAVHVGDTGWADVVGARAAGVRPVHLDPWGFCPFPADHDHVVDLDGVVALVDAGDAAQ